MKLPVILVIILLPLVAQGQPTENRESNIAFDVGFGDTQGTLSLAINHNWFLGKNKRVLVGLGGRFTGYVGRNKYYITAPAALTSNGTGPLVIFKENVVANIDTFLIQKPSVYSLNVAVNLGYRFSPKFLAGFNIDAVGASFGRLRRGNYINGQQGQMVNAGVSTFNALLVSDNDLGSLNSELYGSFSFNDRWSLRAGAQFLFTEYTTDSKVQNFPEPNDRFRKKSLMFMIGTSFKLK